MLGSSQENYRRSQEVNKMLRRSPLAGVLLLFVTALAFPQDAGALAVQEVAKCQKKFASAGAQFASRLINFTLKCATPVAQCQIECEEGLFGPSCDGNPPPCCDVDDPMSTPGYGQCLDEAQVICDRMTDKIADAEVIKQIKVINACKGLTIDELCGAETPGLGFAILNAGCQALDPMFTCSLLNLLECVGGPLQAQLGDQMSGLLAPRASEGLVTMGLAHRFPGMPRGRRVKGTVAAGSVDVWAINGAAGDEFTVQLVNLNDNGDGTTGIQPEITMLDRDGQTALADTLMHTEACPVTSMCGNTCPNFSRRLPFSGTFYLQIGSSSGPGCTGGGYKLLVQSPGGIKPILMADDVVPGTFAP
jgi:hypothetical protein